MSNDTEPRVRDALAAIAGQGGRPDEAAAWDRIAAGIDADRRSAGRRRAMFATAGLALVGSAAAVLALVVADDGPQQSVRVVSPATDPSTEPTADPTTAPTVTVAPPPSTPVTEAPPMTHTGPTVVDPDDAAAAPEVSAPSGPAPAHPMAAVVAHEGGGAYIRVYDGDTGEPIATPVGPSQHGYEDLSFGPDDALWFTEELGDSRAVTRVAWGSTTKETPFGTESLSPAVSPDGTTLAYVHDGTTVERASIRFVDLATGEQTAELTWRDDDPDFFHTQGSVSGLEWSPDGGRLLFVSGYEGAEVLVLDRDAASLSEATPLVASDARDAHWAGAGTVVTIDNCCYPDHDNLEVQVHDLATGEVTVAEVDGRPLAVDVRPDGAIGVLTDAGVVQLLGGGALEPAPGALDFAF